MRTARSALLVSALLLAWSPALAEDFIWIEGENPSRIPEVAAQAEEIHLQGTNKPEWLSEGKMLQMMLPPERAKEVLGSNGIVFGYEANVPAEGAWHFWARIGYAGSRSDFDYRVDGGKWIPVASKAPTQDIYELSVWNPIGWIRLETLKLDKGKHIIEFRHKPYAVEQDKGPAKPSRTLHMLDAICLTTQSHWVPNGKHKPGQPYKTDSDRAAGETVYDMPVSNQGHRSNVRLTGLWEIARWDERTVDPATRLEMPEKLPDLSKLHWYGIEVPGDRNAKRPDMKYAHRYLYRTRVRVPEEMADRGWVLRMERFSMIAAVFVNGQFCGWNRNCQSIWSCDVTGAIKPGEINEIVVAFKDVVYGIDPSRAKGRKDNLSHYAYFPLNMTFHVGIGMLMDMPVSWGHGGTAETGLAEPVILTAAGKVYTEDVFAIPSFQDKKLDLEITLHNPTSLEVQVEMENLVRPRDGGKAQEQVSLRFENRTLTLAPRASKSITLSQPWAKPHLWFPDDPFMYQVETILRIDGKPVDLRKTPFGFRQWGWKDTTAFTCNSVPWIFWCYAGKVDSAAELIEQCKRTGKNSIRYSVWANHIVDTDPRKISTSELLDELDRNGIVVRFNSLFDGEVANYGQGLTQDGRATYNRVLFGHLKDQFTQWVKGYRNHPSLLIWSLDNEIVYVNAHLQGQGQQWEPASRLLARHVMKVDPTRPVMVDGGRALRDPAEWKGVDDEVRKLGHLPVNGCHYNELKNYDVRDYPDAAYSAEGWYKGPPPFGPWPMVRNQPIFMGECFYARGWSLAKMASIGGEQCFVGYAQTYAARSKFMRWLSEGYRWNHTVAAWDFGLEKADDDFQIAWKPIALFCRQWTGHMTAGQKNPRLLKAINQTSQNVTLDLAYALTEGGETLTSRTRQVVLGPGWDRLWPVEVELPAIQQDRLDATFVLSIHRDGKEVFRDERPMRIYRSQSSRPVNMPSGMKLRVMDSKGLLTRKLQEMKLDFEPLAKPEDLPAGESLLLIAPGELAADQATKPIWQRLAADGARIVVLEQVHPLKYQALPADLDPVDVEGRIAFSENPAHPIFERIHRDDLSLWSPDHLTYRKPYRKATSGAVSLVQCDEELSCSAVAECRIGSGMLLLSQLCIGQKLGVDPVADRLLENMLRYGASYELPNKTSAIVVDSSDPRWSLLTDTGLKGRQVADVAAAISGKHRIAIIDATPSNLKALADSAPTVRSFVDSGGWIVLWGLEPDGLESFNRLVGVNHLLRPYSMELPRLRMPRDPLAAGMTYRDIIMTTGERIMRWKGTEWMSPHVFSYVVDYRDIAPFCTINGASPSAKTPKEPNARNVVNNLTSDEMWVYLYYMHVDAGEPDYLKLELPRRETPERFQIRFSTGYTTVEKIQALWGQGADVTFNVESDTSVQSFDLPSQPTDEFTVKFSKWTQTGKRPVLAVENFSLPVHRSEDFLAKVQPLTLPAGLVRYPMGKGGVVLNQLKILPREANPINAAKKASLVRALLENLGAAFAGRKPVIVGSGLEYQPVKIDPTLYNAYLDASGQPGWFTYPDRRAPKVNFSALPKGRQRLAGALYEVFDFKTSPAAASLMLAGQGSTTTEKQITIPVGRKADALFFLHACNPGRDLLRWQQRFETRPDKAGDPPTVFRYVIHYADGEKVQVPVVWNQSVGSWLVKQEPENQLSAAVAWAAKVDAKDSWHLAAWSMQWNNPRPEVKIESVDLLGSPEEGKRFGAAALLGLTTAHVRNQP